MIVVVDTGLGNVGSVLNMIKHLGFKAVISKDIADIENAQKIILPGVGTFDAGMKALRTRGLVDVLNHKTNDSHAQILGICLGMQLMLEGSEEGQEAGLGWFEGSCKKFPDTINNQSLKVPHMGWNTVEPLKNEALFNKVEEETQFYFVHSYYAELKNEAEILTKTTYGESFASGIHKNNIFGVQFHPEKSHAFGFHFLKTFLNL